MQIRLNKFIADSGICSRRAADKLISEGKIQINGIVTREMGCKVNPSSDKIVYDGKVLNNSQKFVYYMVNKPVGYICSISDPFAHHKITELVPDTHRVFPVGRLDKDTQGLIILTNDGDLSYQLTHPKFKHQKTYEVEFRISYLKKNVTQSNALFCINELKRGVHLEEGVAKFDEINLIEVNREKQTVTISVVLHQGWKRQIRRMLGALGLKIVVLKRVKINKLELGDLEAGKYKVINKKDIL